MNRIGESRDRRCHDGRCDGGDEACHRGHPQAGVHVRSGSEFRGRGRSGYYGPGYYPPGPCAYYNYYYSGYCGYPMYNDPVWIGGVWYNGPHYRWWGGQPYVWAHGGWHGDFRGGHAGRWHR